MLQQSWKASSPLELALDFAARRFAISGSVAITVMVATYLFPKLRQKIPNTSCLRIFGDYLKLDWIGAVLTDFAVSSVTYTIGYHLSGALKKGFSSWVHALYYTEGFIPSLIGNRFTGAVTVPWPDYAKSITKADWDVQLELDYVSTAKYRIMALLHVLIAHSKKENTSPLSASLLKWTVDTVMRFISTRIGGEILRRLPEWCNKRPLTWYAVMYLSVWVVFAWVASLINGRIDATVVARYVEERRAQEQTLMENNDARDAELKELMQAQQSEIFQLERMETVQIAEVREAARCVLESNTCHNGARLEALRLFSFLQFYEDGVMRGVVPRGAESSLADTARFYEVDTLTASMDSTHVTCAICLEDYVHGSKVAELNCKHVFHEQCIRDWLAGKKHCPCCRNDIRHEPGEGDHSPSASETRSLILQKLRDWQSHVLPTDTQTGNWGGVQNYARFAGHRILEDVLGQIDPAFDSNQSSITDLVVLVVVTFLDLTPPNVDGF